MAAVSSTSGVMAQVNLIMLSKQMDQMKTEGSQMADMVKNTNIVTANKLDVRI